MLVDNANSISANIPIENQSAKQHLIPSLKAWKAENLGTTIVNTSLAYDEWKGNEYVLAFGDNLATRVIAHNGKSGQPVEPSSGGGLSLPWDTDKYVLTKIVLVVDSAMY